MKKSDLKKVLKKATGCNLQHTGWPCGTCFFAVSDELTNQDWQALLLYRGDYKESELDNLPEDIEASLKKIYRLAINRVNDL